MHRLAFRLHDLGATKWAICRHFEGLRPSRMRWHRADHLRDDVAGALDDHGVALANVLAVDVLLVVQRRLRHRHAADLDGLELRPRVERSGSPDADVNLLELRLRGHRRPLVGARPSRTLVQRAEPPLLLERVDLDHDPVDLVVELDPLPFPGAARFRDGRDRLVTLGERIRAEAVLAKPLQ